MSIANEMFEKLGYTKKMRSVCPIVGVMRKRFGLQITEIAFDLVTADVKVETFTWGDWGKHIPVPYELSADEVLAVAEMVKEIKEFALLNKINNLKNESGLFSIKNYL